MDGVNELRIVINVDSASVASLAQAERYLHATVNLACHVLMVRSKFVLFQFVTRARFRSSE